MIHRVSVELSYQGRGIGAMLVRAIEDAHPNVVRFTLTTNTLVPGNVAFYERRRYQVTELTKHGDKTWRQNRIGTNGESQGRMHLVTVQCTAFCP